MCHGPFQKQLSANVMAADTAVPREEYTLIIRQYNIGITRLFLGFGEYELTDPVGNAAIQRTDSQSTFVCREAGEANGFFFTQDGTKRAAINVEEPALDRWSALLPDPPRETLDITLYPDGKREIRLAAYDHFPPL